MIGIAYNNNLREILKFVCVETYFCTLGHSDNVIFINQCYVLARSIAVGSLTLCHLTEVYMAGLKITML